MKIKFNENKELVKEIQEQLSRNDGYCPCSIIKDNDTKCMCKAFRKQIEPGLCHCGLYNKVK